jgi:hypothetical protein
MRMKYAIAGLLLAVLTTGGADAAGSNIALSEYPGPQCAKPQKPVPPQMPSDIDAPGAAAGYNLKVKQFNAAVAGYNSASADFGACMKTYVDNGDADMQRIKQKLDEAVAAANGP